MDALSNGVPLDIVEGLLDVVATVERAGEFDPGIDPDEMWMTEAEFSGGGTIDMDLARRNCLLAMAKGDRDGAESFLNFMKACVAGCFAARDGRDGR